MKVILTYSIGSNQFNGQTTASIANLQELLLIRYLQPFTVTEKELGLEARLFNNKVHFDLASFNKVTTDQIMSINLSDASGYASSKQNIGSLKNRGMEFLIEYTPVKPVTSAGQLHGTLLI